MHAPRTGACTSPPPPPPPAKGRPAFQHARRDRGMTEQVRAPATTLTRRPRGEPSSAICRVLTADSGYRHVVNACGREQAGGGIDLPAQRHVPHCNPTTACSALGSQEAGGGAVMGRFPPPSPALPGGPPLRCETTGGPRTVNMPPPTMKNFCLSSLARGGGTATASAPGPWAAGPQATRITPAPTPAGLLHLCRAPKLYARPGGPGPNASRACEECVCAMVLGPCALPSHLSQLMSVDPLRPSMAPGCPRRAALSEQPVCSHEQGGLPGTSICKQK